MGLALPLQRITVNLAPADLLKEGSHFDLPIAIALLAAMGVVPRDLLDGYAALGELALDGAIAPVAGVLPAAVHASARRLGLICPAAQGGEAAWAAGIEVLAAPTLLALVNHFKGTQVLIPPDAEDRRRHAVHYADLGDIKGQETAKRALEIAAAGGHSLLMVGPPGSGKSMLASRMPGLLPPLDPAEALEVSMIHSVAGVLQGGGLTPATALSRPASLGVGGGAGRRRPPRTAGRGVARPPRRAVPRRVAGVPARGPGGAAPAAGKRPRHRRPRQRPRHLSGARPAGGRHEP